MSPQTIAHYRITAKLGAGGMGEVYRATDTKLAREVAIKIIPPRFAEDPDRLARFAREAQVLAALNHPNIAAIYGVEDCALVMELVEGPTLAQRIDAGPMPLEEALPLAKQVAEAIEYAHEKGVVHRDLKPANIKITAPGAGYEGRAKVLDFGLATMVQGSAQASGDAASDPNHTVTLTATTGMITGTAAYMSPEQARGQTAGKRSDIWAFGVVLYEMLTGRRMFTGDTVSDTLAAVLRADLDWSALPPETPAAIRRLLRRSVERDRTRRLADIADARLEIEEAMAAPAEPAAAPPAGHSRRAWAAAACVLAIGLSATALRLWQVTRPVDRPLQRFDIDIDPPSVNNPLHALSPDGSRVVFLARDRDGAARLNVRLLDQSTPMPLAGTENARDPFFSPDGQWLVFASEGALKKMPIQGGAPVKLCDAPDMRGGSWGEDGNIVFAPENRSGLYRVPASGGSPQPFTELKNGEISHRHPQVLPGAQAVLFSATTVPNNFEEGNIQIRFLKSSATKTVLHGGYYGRYLPGGYLLWVHQGTLFAAAMDPSSGELRGPHFPVLENLAVNPTRGVGQFAFSATGIFAGLTGVRVSKRSIEWLEPAGKTQAWPAPPADYTSPRISPDGKRIVLDVRDGVKSDLLVYEPERQRLSSLTFTGAAADPVWTPDGKHLVFLIVDRYNKLGWLRADGSSQPEVLLGRQEGLVPVQPDSFTPDGKRLVFTATGPQSGRDLWTVPLDWRDPEHPIAGKPEPLLHTPAREESGMVSPDGRWLAYTSTEGPGTQHQVYVQPFPPTGGKWKISETGGTSPTWSRNGRELFFLSEEGRVMAAANRAEGNSFVADRPRAWSQAAVPISGGWYDIMPDGKSALVVRPGDEKEHTSRRLSFLLNFPDEVRRHGAEGK